tara:strand:+ start:296 stop:736 length:441 start_codon:yes stop_codon:yes gene_type:complete
MAAEIVFNNAYLTEMIAEQLDCDFRKKNLMRLSEINKNTEMITREYRKELKNFELEYVKEKYETLVSEYMDWWSYVKKEPYVFFFIIDEGTNILENLESLVDKYESLMTEICGCDARQVVEDSKNRLEEYYTYRVGEEHDLMESGY